MDNPLNFTLPPVSLSKLSSVKIAISLVETSLEDQSANGLLKYSEAFESLKKRLLENVKNVKLSEIFTSNLRNYLIFAIKEVRSWYFLFENIFYLSVNQDILLTRHVLKNIAWMGRGQIDHEVTARNFATNGSCLTLDVRYRLACTFHLEDLVRQLWMEMRAENGKWNKANVQSNETFEVVYWSFEMMKQPDKLILNYVKEQAAEIYNNRNDSFATHFLKLELSRLRVSRKQRIYIYSLMYSLCMNKLHSIRYFYKQCDDSYRKYVFQTIYDWSYVELSNAVHLFYFSTRDAVKLTELFQECEIATLRAFTSIPAEMFRKIFISLKSVIKEKRFFQVLSAIAEHDVTPEDGVISPIDTDWGYIFYDIWINLVPETYRAYVLSQTGEENPGDGLVVELLEKLYHSGQFESAVLLLESTTSNLRISYFKDIIEPAGFLGLEDSKVEFIKKIVPYLATSAEDLKYLYEVALLKSEDSPFWEEVTLLIEGCVSLERKVEDEA